MMVHTIEGLTFKYEGGMYIDIFTPDVEYPVEAINVIDQDGTCRVNGLADFYAECEAWFSDENDSDDDWEDESEDDSCDEFDDFESDLGNEWESFV